MGLPNPINDIKNHKPVSDHDDDLFSTKPELRGSHWRGKDCNDNDNTIYPGRNASSHNPTVDHNCNGIAGVDPADGVSYEEKFCGNSQPRGIITLGDSASAHFRLPSEWFWAAKVNSSTYQHDATRVEDEMDWPQCSWSTGYDANSNCPRSAFPVSSIASRLRQRNLCNHRDFQACLSSFSVPYFFFLLLFICLPFFQFLFGHTTYCFFVFLSVFLPCVCGVLLSLAEHGCERICRQ